MSDIKVMIPRSDPDAEAKDFNERVWASPFMITAQAGCLAAFEELRAEGWGMLALENAERCLKDALESIAKLKALKEAR